MPEASEDDSPPLCPECHHVQLKMPLITFIVEDMFLKDNKHDRPLYYLFPEIELEHEYDPKPQLSNSILLPDLIMTPVSSPDFNPSLESTLDSVAAHREIESPIFMIIILNLTNFILLKVLLTNW